MRLTKKLLVSIALLTVSGAVSLMAACVGDSPDTTSGNDASTLNDGGTQPEASDVDACTPCATATGTVCVHLDRDSQNCGTCGTQCTSGTTCIDAQCGCAPLNGVERTLCKFQASPPPLPPIVTCSNLQTDNQNCGGCNNTCLTDDCTAGECGSRAVFIARSDTFTNLAVTDAGLTDPIAAADAICNAAATQTLRGHFMAWISSSASSPSTRFEKSTKPYILPDGTEVAKNWTALTSGTLEHPIDLDPSGMPNSNPNFVANRAMTATNPDGTYATGQYCAGWTVGTYEEDAGGTSILVGASLDADAGWTATSGAQYGWNCNEQYNLYCMQQKP